MQRSDAAGYVASLPYELRDAREPPNLDSRCGSSVAAGQAEIALTSGNITCSCRDLKGHLNSAVPVGRVRISENREVTGARPAESCTEPPSQPDRCIEVCHLKHGHLAWSAT